MWPYLKPLRKWIKKRQLTNPEGLWDMPVVTTPPGQQQQHYQQQHQVPQQHSQPKRGQRQQGADPNDLWDMPVTATPPSQQRENSQKKGQRQQAADPSDLWDMPAMTTPLSQQQQQREKSQKKGKKQQRNDADGLWDMPVIDTPASQQQQQQRGAVSAGQMSPLQQVAQSERRSGGGSPKHALHLQFHEAAIAQAKQTAAVSTGPQLAPVKATAQAPAPAAATTPAAMLGGAGSRSMHDIPASGTLAKLFGNAVTQKSRAASSGDLLSCTPGTFTFNRQPILHALNCQGVALRQQISGRG